MASLNPSYFVPKLEDPLEYHAFLTHCEDDFEFAKDLLEKIESYKFKCAFAKRDFYPGAPIVENISNAIHRSRRTILVISRASLHSPWCKYEMLAVIDDSNKNNRISFIPLIMADVPEEILPNTVRFVDYVQLGRDTNYLDKILKTLAAPDKNWETMIPAGNVAHGLAWSYYYGYLRLVLPDIEKRIQNSQFWHINPLKRRICQKLLLLFPVSCCCKDTLTQDDNRIKPAGHLETVKRNRAGTVGREYKSTVYSLEDKNGQIYYFVGEYVTSIHVMYEMEQSGLAGLKTNDKRLQATRFLITIKDILNRDKACAHRYRIINYNDVENGKKTDVSELLVTAIREEIQLEQRYAERQLSLPLPTRKQNRNMERRSISENNDEASTPNIRSTDSQPCPNVADVVESDSTPFYEFLLQGRDEAVRNEGREIVKTRATNHSHGDGTEIRENRNGDILYIRTGNEFNNILL